MTAQLWPKNRTLVNQRFGRLVVISSFIRLGKLRVTVQCDCGTSKEVDGSNIKYGHTVSCGCVNRDRMRSYRPIPVKSYEDMKSRAFIDMRTGCILWNLFVTKSGYGRVQYNGKQRGAHRVSWSFRHGKIPPGFEVVHTCDALYKAGDITYRKCFNQDHLTIGTHQENMDRMVALGRSSNGTLKKKTAQSK